MNNPGLSALALISVKGGRETVGDLRNESEFPPDCGGDISPNNDVAVVFPTQSDTPVPFFFFRLGKVTVDGKMADLSSVALRLRIESRGTLQRSMRRV